MPRIPLRELKPALFEDERITEDEEESSDDDNQGYTFHLKDLSLMTCNVK